MFNSLTEITVPSSVQFIRPFYGGHTINLKLNFDSSETYNFIIGQQGLQKLYAGTSVPCDLILPEGCTQLATYAIMENTFSGTFEIPASVTTLGDYVFSQCTNLQYIKFRGTTPPTVSQNTFKTNVGNYVFEWATFLTIQVPSAALNTYKTYSSAWQAIDQNLTIVGY